MRHATELRFDLEPPPPGKTWQGWLYASIREAIHAGRLKPGARLPPSRDWARQLGISRSWFCPTGCATLSVARCR